MNFWGKTGPWMLLVLSIVPALLWLPNSAFDTSTATLRSLGQVTALVGTALLCLNYLLSARVKWIESFFNGLNRVYIVHALVGSVGFSLILLHPVFIIISYLTISLEAAWSLTLPSLDNIPVLLGSMSLFLMMFLIFLTVYIKLEYSVWKKTHEWMSFALVLASGHAFLIGSTLAINFPLKVYMYSLIILGLISALYKQTAWIHKINFYNFAVSGVDVFQDVTVLRLKSLTRPFKHKPGQFAFIDIRSKGVSKESHPFSIVSAPGEEELKFAAKSLGDYTETLKLVKVGAPVHVEGPFGRFSYAYHPNKKQIWVAGGIGVTPFLSMLSSLSPEQNFSVTFIYSVKDRSEAVFLDEINAKISSLPGVNFILWIAKDMGFLKGESLLKVNQDLLERDIFVCGPPPMMNALKNQLLALGVKKNKIHTEEFSMN